MSANIIEFANAQQTIAEMGAINTQVSGMTFAEAESALGAQVANNGMRLVGFENQAASQVLNFPNATSAGDAVIDFQASHGLQTAANAAINSGKTISAGTVALCKSSQVPVGVCGVATGGAGIAAAACAPIFGAALGVGLYEMAPEFWTKLSQTLLPWAYPDTGAVPFYYDAQGNTYMDAEMIQAIKQLMMAEGYLFDYNAVNTEGTELVSPLAYKIFTVGDSWKTADNHTISIRGTGTATMFAVGIDVANGIPLGGALNGEGGFYVYDETTQGYGVGLAGYNYTLNDVTHYVWAMSLSVNYVQDLLSLGVPQCASQNLDAKEVGWQMLETPLPNPTETNPSIEEWQGEPYPLTPNTMDLYVGEEGGTSQFKTLQQVALPIGDPLVTNNPDIQPSPYINPSPIEVPITEPTPVGSPTPVEYPAIDPYVNPYPSPDFYPEDVPFESPESNPAPLPSTEVVPVPNTEVVPNPDALPDTASSSVPSNNPEAEPNTSGGSTPTGGLPLIPLFPLGSDASLYHVYNPTQAQIDAFGSWLWQSFLDTLFDDLSRWFNNPMDAVISLQEFYGNPVIQSTGTIRCGYLDSHIQSDIVGTRYGEINCGSVVVPEEYGNYLDYAPYTQVFIYLPFIGIMSLNADDIIGNAVNVKYHTDCYNGSCIAMVTVAREGYEALVYQFEGNCSVDIPLTGGQQSALKGAVIGGISGAVMGGIPGAIAGAVIGGLSSKNDVQHSGSFSASYGAMGLKKPFIIVRRPVQKVVMNYNESYGFQAHKMVYVGNCRGYLRAKEIRVLSTTATNEEKNMIVRALKDGVYVKD